MIRLKRVLFPTDFSDCSRTAQEYACALAEQFQAELHLLHVVQDAALMLPEPNLGLSLPPNYLVDLKQGAAQAMERLLPEEWRRKNSVVQSVTLGNPFVEIVRYASQHEIDLIVLGTHGRSALMHVLLGSVAEKVVRKAPCPVLTVRPVGHQFVAP